MCRMIVSELPTLDASYTMQNSDSDDDSDDGEDTTEPILDVRAARDRVVAARKSADVHKTVADIVVRMCKSHRFRNNDRLNQASFHLRYSGGKSKLEDSTEETIASVKDEGSQLEGLGATDESTKKWLHTYGCP